MPKNPSTHNSVELLGTYGGDLTHACSGWTSTQRDLTPEKITRIPEFLKMLATNGHHTPFEKSMLHFLVTVDTATHIHLIKHRIGVSVNGESARYKELKDDKYVIPHDWPEIEQAHLESHVQDSLRQYHAALERLTPLVGRKRAKESARFYLPYANQISLDISFNWRSLSHFLGLRNTTHAQKEVRDVASIMLGLIKEIPGEPFKFTIAAFKEAGLLGDHV